MRSLERNDTVRAWRSRYARLVLERCQGDKSQACRVLDISYHTLRAYLRYPPGRNGTGTTEDASRLMVSRVVDKADRSSKSEGQLADGP